METFIFVFVPFALLLSVVFCSFSIRSLEKEVKTMIGQHWDLLDYTSSNGVTSKDLLPFFEAQASAKYLRKTRVVERLVDSVLKGFEWDDALKEYTPGVRFVIFFSKDEYQSLKLWLEGKQ